MEWAIRIVLLVTVSLAANFAVKPFDNQLLTGAVAGIVICTPGTWLTQLIERASTGLDSFLSKWLKEIQINSQKIELKQTIKFKYFPEELNLSLWQSIFLLLISSSASILIFNQLNSASRTKINNFSEWLSYLTTIATFTSLLLLSYGITLSSLSLLERVRNFSKYESQVKARLAKLGLGEDEAAVFFSSASEEALQSHLSSDTFNSAKIEKVASELGMTASVLMERIGNKQLIVKDPEEIEDLQDLRDARVSLSEAKDFGTTSLTAFKQELGL